MKLKAYLAARDEGVEPFAKRADLWPYTIRRVLAGETCSARALGRIVAASQKEPTADGGTVDWTDLVPERERRLLQRISGGS